MTGGVSVRDVEVCSYSKVLLRQISTSQQQHDLGKEWGGLLECSPVEIDWLTLDQCTTGKQVHRSICGILEETRQIAYSGFV